MNSSPGHFVFLAKVVLASLLTNPLNSNQQYGYRLLRIILFSSL